MEGGRREEEKFLFEKAVDLKNLKSQSHCQGKSQAFWGIGEEGMRDGGWREEEEGGRKEEEENGRSYF